MVARDTAVPLRGEEDVVSADLVPDLLGVARGAVAVKVTEVMVDLIQVPLLRSQGGGGDRGQTQEVRKTTLQRDPESSTVFRRVTFRSRGSMPTIRGFGMGGRK